jgi:ANTAR domain-containing protein
MPDSLRAIGPANRTARLASARSRSERAWRDIQATWARAQEIQARYTRAANPSPRELLTVSLFARLQAQLASMPVIEQAKGVLIAQQACGAEEAFDLLRRASQRANVPVRELAEQIVANAQRGRAPKS